MIKSDKYQSINACYQGLFLLTRMKCETRISTHTHCKMWDEITCTVEVLEGISNFIRRFIIDVITYPFWDLR